MTVRPASVAERLGEIRERMQAAARRCGRDPDSITLVGASKGQPVEVLRRAWRAGLRIFAENRVQEALVKMPQLPAEAEWHLIGPLQSNKARRAAEAFAVVQSVDRMKIARALDRSAGELGRRLPCLLEINLGEEATKHGFAEGELEAAFEELVAFDHLEIRGLMAIPPRVATAEQSRPWFRRLARLRDRLEGRAGWDRGTGWLSMGMSDDYEVAIEEGATHVRVGTALFGPRDRASTSGESPGEDVQ